MEEIRTREHEQWVRIKEEDIRAFDKADDLLQSAHRAFIKGKETVEGPFQENIETPEQYSSRQLREGKDTLTVAASKGIKDVIDEERMETGGGKPAPSGTYGETGMSPRQEVSPVNQPDHALQRQYTGMHGDARYINMHRNSGSFPPGRTGTNGINTNIQPTGNPPPQGTAQPYTVQPNISPGYRPTPASHTYGRPPVPGYCYNQGGAGTASPAGSQETAASAVRTREPVYVREYRHSIKQADRGIRTAEASGKAVKTEKAIRNEERVRRGARAAGSSVRTSAAQSAGATASAQGGAVYTETAAQGAAAGAWIFWVILAGIILIMIIAANIAGSYLTGQMDEESRPVHEVIRDINAEYNSRLLELRSQRDYENVTMTGSRARWSDMLAVYSARTMNSPEEEVEPAFMNFYYITESGEETLWDIFWAMNDIDADETHQRVREWSRTEEDDGTVAYEPQWVTVWNLAITVSSKSAQEMAERPLYMNDEQRGLLNEMLSEEYDELWQELVYGYLPEDCPIVETALREVGNIGGEKYWSWYGFGSHVDWCACFVSWCANECGYMAHGTFPKYSRCVNGVEWFQQRGQWVGSEEEPLPGMIIFFDWDHPDGRSGPQDGHADHTGIVERVEDGVIYTIEGNAWDICMQNQYPVGHYEILGYGMYETEADQ